VRHGLAGGVLGDLLGGEGRAFARAFEADPAGAGPAEEIAVHVGNGHLGVVESGQNIGDAVGDVLGAFGLDDLLGVGIFAQQLGGRRSGGGDGSARCSRGGGANSGGSPGGGATFGSVGGSGSAFSRLARGFAFLLGV